MARQIVIDGVEYRASLEQVVALKHASGKARAQGQEAWADVLWGRARAVENYLPNHVKDTVWKAGESVYQK